jgi:two-component system cell cycle response regulator DivK
VSLSILLVEDNELNRDMLSRRLLRAGHAVETAENGVEALAAIRAQQPDVVLLDMNLPIMDGWTTCQEVRRDPSISDMPIIALTAHAMGEDRVRALEAGCNDYATKPVDFPELLKKISLLTGGDLQP